MENGGHITASAGYGRDAYMQRVYGSNKVCDFCNEESYTLIEWDNSEGEYGPHYICMDCLHKVMISEPNDERYCYKCKEYKGYKDTILLDDKDVCKKCRNIMKIELSPFMLSFYG